MVKTVHLTFYRFLDYCKEMCPLKIDCNRCLG